MAEKRGKAKISWEDAEEFMKYHGNGRVLGSALRPDTWADTKTSLRILQAGNFGDLVKPSNLMWHVATVNAENRLNGPPLDVIISGT